MGEERDHVHIKFSYTDRFGHTTNLYKKSGVENVDENPANEFGFLLDQFKVFLHSCEFSDKTIDKIQWKI